METNLFAYKKMLQVNPNIRNIKYDPKSDSLYLNGKSVSLKNFDLLSFLQNPQMSLFTSDFATLKEEDIYKVIEIHAKSIEIAQEKKKEEEQLNDLTKLANPENENSNIHIIHKKEEYGEKILVHYVDEQGVDHVLDKYAPTDISAVYQSLLQSGKQKITDKDIYEALERRMKNVSLESSVAANNKMERSKEYLHEMNALEKGNRENATTVKGNEEHNVFLKDHEVVTFDKNENGDLIRESHTGTDIENREADANETEKVEQPTDEIAKELETKRISIEKYFSYIHKETPLTEKETEEKNYMESYFYDLQTYEKYLLPELANLLRIYRNEIEKIAFLENKNENEANALKAYQDMQERLDLSQNKELNQEKIRELIRKKPELKEAGYVQSSLLAILTIFSGMTLAGLIYLFLK